MEKMRPGVEVFNYADEPQLCVSDIARVIAEALGKMRPISVPYSLAYLMGLPFDLAIKLTGRTFPFRRCASRNFARPRIMARRRCFKLGFNRSGPQRKV
jgi:hypothetical protein